MKRHLKDDYLCKRMVLINSKKFILDRFVSFPIHYDSRVFMVNFGVYPENPSKDVLKLIYEDLKNGFIEGSVVFEKRKYSYSVDIMYSSTEEEYRDGLDS